MKLSNFTNRILDVPPFINAQQFLKSKINRKLVLRLSTEFIGQLTQMLSSYDSYDFISNGWQDVRAVLLFVFRQRLCRETVVSWYNVLSTSERVVTCYSTCNSASAPSNWQRTVPTIAPGKLLHYLSWQKVH